MKVPFTITQYSSKHGLPQSQVLSIVPKENGSLLISTSNGIVEFNGSEFKSIIKNGEYRDEVYSKLLYHEKTKQIFGEKMDGALYLLSPHYKLLNPCRASYIENDSIYSVDIVGDISAADVHDLKFTKIAKTGISKATCLISEKNSFIIGNGSSVFRYNLKTKYCQLLLKDDALDFKINPYNKLVYIICAKRIYTLSGSLIKTLWLDNESKDIICSDIAFVDSKTFYLATIQGLFRVSGNVTHKENSMPSRYIQSLYYNKAENFLFAGTGDKGLLKLLFKDCYYLSAKQGFNENASLRAIIKTKSGDILSAPNGVIYKIDKDTVYPYCQLHNLYASLSEINDTIYAGTWGGGIILINNKQLVGTVNNKKNIKTGYIYAVFRDSKKNIWVGGSDGISKGTTAQNVIPCLYDTIKADVVAFYELKDGTICVGGTRGFFILGKNGTLIKHIGRKQGLQGKEVRSFYEDAEGKLWIGTYGGGLYCYYKNNLTCINELKNSKLDVDVFCMAKDNLGYIYITTNHGLWRVKEKDLSDFYYGKLDYLIPFYYGEENGILNTEFNGGFQNTYLKTGTGDFYFPSIQGVVRVKPEKPYFKKLSPELDRILINDTLSGFEHKIFDRTTYSVQFDFSSVKLLNKYNAYYQYKLESNGNGTWSPLQRNTSVSFKLLPPNTYTFYLRAVDARMDRNPTEIKFEFEIKPYFYETAWFKILFTVLFLLLILVISRAAVKRSRKKAKEQEQIKRELAELELKAVQAQMNPHFIFNSLNSIKHYLFINDTKSADTFIDNFSILLRDFLEYSNKDFITLEKEAEMLSSYLSLESMRMNPPFKYNILLPETLYKLEIPTLLFQAFVENAVKHGITHSSKACSITIEFKLLNHTLFCEITDDGIGRKKAGEINRSKTHHISKGISIIEEKIRIIKATYNLHVDYKIDDRPGLNNEPGGTIVTLKIPVKHDD